MWYIILFNIVIFKLLVSANQFQYRSVVDMTNIHRTKVMLPVEPAPPESVQHVPNQEPTTCIDVGGRYEGGIYRNPETVCNTIQRRPETRRQVTPTTQMLRYYRVPTQMPPRHLGPQPPGMIKPQIMLDMMHPKQSNNNPQNVARTPTQVMMPRLLLEARQRPVQQPTPAGQRQPEYHPSVENRDFQEYQLFPQVLHPDNGNRDHQEYQSLPQAVNLNDGKRDQQEILYQKGQARSTSTAAPQLLRDEVTVPKSTTSTMPPFPGGFIPENGDNVLPGNQSQVCAGKAKCSQYFWTTKKHHLRTTQEFLLWTP